MDMKHNWSVWKSHADIKSKKVIVVRLIKYHALEIHVELRRSSIHSKRKTEQKKE
jgi:hypothetical protein